MNTRRRPSFYGPDHEECSLGPIDREYAENEIEILPPGSFPGTRRTWRGRSDFDTPTKEGRQLNGLERVRREWWREVGETEEVKKDVWLKRQDRENLPRRAELMRIRLEHQIQDERDQYEREAEQKKRQDELAELDHQKALAKRQWETASAFDKAEIERRIETLDAEKRELEAEAKRNNAKADALEAQAKVQENMRRLAAAADPSRPAPAAPPTPQMRAAEEISTKKRANMQYIQQEIDALLATVGGDPNKLSPEQYELYEDRKNTLYQANAMVDKEAVEAAVRGKPNGQRRP